MLEFGSWSRLLSQTETSLASSAGWSSNCLKDMPLATWDAHLGWRERIVLWVLRQGVVPKHVAIAPDGNRRFARKNGMELSHAYYVMLQMLTRMWSYMEALGVTEVTCFLLSARNVNRSTAELAAVVDELKSFFRNGVNSVNLLRKRQLGVKIVGNFDLLPKDMHANIAQIEVATDVECSTMKLTLWAAYSSKLSLRNVVMDLASAVRAGVIKSDDINADLIADWLALSEASETELWFRSSGEKRFSEFLVLQSGYSYMHHEPRMWPAVTFWNWISAIVLFQLNWPHIKVVKDKHRALWASQNNWNDHAKVIRQRCFLNNVSSTKLTRTERLLSSELTAPNKCHNTNE